MNKKAKKVAAAITAINILLEEEAVTAKKMVEETKAEQYKKTSSSPIKEEMLKEVRNYSTYWAVSGRMEMMNSRTLWQLKLYK